jgi:hypothetical protein
MVYATVRANQETAMKSVIVLGVLATTLGACVAPPVRNLPIISYDGEFRGPVVADAGVPISARYQGYCESPPYRWRHGWYRAYTPQPCPVVERTVVRALY